MGCLNYGAHLGTMLDDALMILGFCPWLEMATKHNTVMAARQRHHVTAIRCEVIAHLDTPRLDLDSQVIVELPVKLKSAKGG